MHLKRRSLNLLTPLRFLKNIYRDIAMKKHNFFAGPAILAQQVKEKAAQAALDYNNSGLSLMEVSHRGKDFIAILDRAEAATRNLYGLSDEYAVLFLTGGASTQFFMTAMNLANSEDHVGYLDTGTWSSKAIKEAGRFCKVNVLASSSDKNYNYIPRSYNIPDNLKYLHLTSNNTIYGTQLFDWPETEVPLVCDMSSDIFSREIPLSRFGLIYAGAQKNAGTAGVTLVIVKKDMLGKVDRSIPTMLDYNTHIKKSSSFNTPPVFPIYVAMLTMEWVIELGGVKAMADRNAEKAALLYNEVDRNPLFKGTTHKEDRSIMNATFVLNDESHEDAFVGMCKEAGIVGLKGHRSVGGFRASMYNALDAESVQVLVSVMQALEEKHV